MNIFAVTKSVQDELAESSLFAEVQPDFAVVIKSRCKGTGFSAPSQSPICGILTTNNMVCYLPSVWDCDIFQKAVILQREIDSFLNRQNYGKDLCKWRRAGSEPAAQRE